MLQDKTIWRFEIFCGPRWHCSFNQCDPDSIPAQN